MGVDRRRRVDEVEMCVQ